MDLFRSELEALRDAGLYRQTRTYERNRFIVTDAKGREFIDFSSNDYLGLSQHPRLIAAAKEAVEMYGVGSTASRLIAGSSPAHASCEAFIAEKKCAESALLFSTGYMTAMGVIPSVVGKEDVIIMDKLAHACLIDGARASGARLRVFPHNNMDRLESLLKSEREKTKGRILVVVESVYSMDGDLCPLLEVVELKERFGALLLVDEAHGLGVLGEEGMGLAEELNLQERIELQMGTLGKAAGGAGGYVAASRELTEIVVNKGRSFIFTTAPPPAQAAVAEEALKLIASEEGKALRAKLGRYRDLLGKSIQGEVLPSAICPIIIGENGTTLQASEELREKGILVPAIRYPTVAKGTARLRVTLSAGHTEEQVKKVIESII